MVIPNYNDIPLFGDEGTSVVYPSRPFSYILEAILRAELVIASSLHAIIVAEAFGVRAQLCLPPGHREHLFKYADYYLSSARSNFRIAASVTEALDFGGEEFGEVDVGMIEQTFPHELYAVSRA